jgi:negative regulator of flagellin synthesis FlgM
MIDKVQRVLGAQYLQKSAGKYKSVSGEAQGDGLEVSAFAKELAKVSSELKKVPEIRNERVDALRKQIQSGTYTPNLTLVAQRLLAAGILQKEE